MNNTWEGLLLLNKKQRKDASKPGHLNARKSDFKEGMRELLDFCKQLFLRHLVSWTKLYTVINAFAGQSYLDFLSFFKIYNDVLAIT